LIKNRNFHNKLSIIKSYNENWYVTYGMQFLTLILDGVNIESQLNSTNLLQQCVECDSATIKTHYRCGNNFLISNKTLLLHAAQSGDKDLIAKIISSSGFTIQLLRQRNNIGQTALLSYACSNYPEKFLGDLKITAYIDVVKSLVANKTSMGHDLKGGSNI